ncbi:MAG: DUF72 domain-containing protein [Sphingomonadaceae bacterium]|nr:DUF72 domain-containing protein [Sphingomonadaceae bacterium]
MIRIGTAGWSVHSRYADTVPPGGTHLERQARVLDCAEINSSFYRPHQPSTYTRWAASTPPGFRFAAKLPKTATHGARLVDTDAIVEAFLAEAGGLDDRLGVLLVQLPPKLAFDAAVAERFFAMLRQRHSGGIACEPRHPSWFEPDAEALLIKHRIGRVVADPLVGSPAAASPGGWPGLAYYRLHGTPRVYFSDYPPETLTAWAAKLRASAAAGAEVWCIFDNTAGSHAVGNVIEMKALVAD